MNRIYLDHAATSPVHPKVAEKITDILCSTFGNPSSIHAFGREARKVLDDSRTILAESIGAKFSEVIFTSGGTEADNQAILGVAYANGHKGKHIITTAIEHHAVLHTCQYLENKGYEITYLAPNEQGIIPVREVEKALREDTILVTMMYANNEIGTIQPIKEIGQLLKNHQAYFHTDAVQAYGTVEINVADLGIDLLSVTAHKVNGPKGIGLLYVKSGTKIHPITFGGEQELKRRAGTENVAFIAGFGEAAIIVKEQLQYKQQFYRELKQVFIETLANEKIDYIVNGSIEESLPHVLNISFPMTNVEAMLVNLDMVGIAASSGSACTAGSIEPSHVLVAMFGKDSVRTQNSIRFSFGLGNTVDLVAEAARNTAGIVRRFQQ